MRTAIFSCCLLALAAGCRTSPQVAAQIEMLNSERRELEDTVYELEYEYKQAVKKIARLEDENNQLRSGSGTSSERRTIPRSDPKSNSSEPKLAPPMVDEGIPTEPKVEFPSSPMREISVQELPPAKGPSTTENRSSPKSGFSHPIGSGMSSTLKLEPNDPRVTHLFINPLLTGGADFDHKPGDDGITVVVEPRNGENNFVPLAGPISVALLDPSLDGEAKRVGRWDFDASEVQRLLENQQTSQGVHLRMKWPGKSPTSNRFQVFIRYTSVDGRNIEAEREIYVTLPGQYSQRWMPRSTPRIPEGSPTFSDAQTVQFADSPARNVSAEPKIEPDSEGPLLLPPITGPSGDEPVRTAIPEWRPYR